MLNFIKWQKLSKFSNLLKFYLVIDTSFGYTKFSQQHTRLYSHVHVLIKITTQSVYVGTAVVGCTMTTKSNEKFK